MSCSKGWLLAPARSTWSYELLCCCAQALAFPRVLWFFTYHKLRAQVKNKQHKITPGPSQTQLATKIVQQKFVFNLAGFDFERFWEVGLPDPRGDFRRQFCRVFPTSISMQKTGVDTAENEPLEGSDYIMPCTRIYR